MQGTRSVAGVVASRTQLEGAGFVVQRPFPTPALTHFDPFLLLDQMGPVDLGPGEAVGAPDHPHRGFETVSYMLAGRFEHRDSQGNHGVLAPGDVQWMTAGAGVVHSEMPEAEFARAGGHLHGFQLWVNLPRRDKMIAPRYQQFAAADIPAAEADEGRVRVRVIAGEALGAQAVIETRTPITYLHYTLAPGAEIEQPVPVEYNLFAFVIAGRGRFDAAGRTAGPADAVFFERDGARALLAAEGDPGGEPLDLLLIGGEPLNEPVARHGPFVMNTAEEIRQAIVDYRGGRMGHIPVRIDGTAR